MSTQIDPIWKNRWDILNNQLEILIEKLKQTSSEYEVSNLLDLVKYFQSFANNHFNYFWRGFQDGSIIESPKYSIGHVLVVVLDQITFELSVLERAADQRIAGSPQMRRALKTADTIARIALQPAVTAKLIQDTAVITYFQKSYSIRVIPYANVALIGIPFTCVPIYTSNYHDPSIREIITRDYLAIPHEVGHYVFWHGRNGDLRATLRQAFPDNTDNNDNQANLENKENYAHWLEEVFADIYGCLIAGPIIAKSFQDLQLEYSSEDFIKGDGDHPKPFLRPSIYSLVLSHRNGPFTDFGKQLEEEWQKIKGLRLSSMGVAEPQNTDQVIQWKENLSTNNKQPLNKMIAKILEQLQGVKVANVESEKNGWWHDYLNEPNLNIGTLYSAFRKRLIKIVEGDNSLEPIPINGVIWENLRQRWEGEFLSHQEQLPDFPSWFYIFRADGWTTQGPGDNPVGGG